MSRRLRKKQLKKRNAYIPAKEVWDLDFYLARHILPRLKKFKEENIHSYPHEFKGTEEWHQEIDKMILAFELILNDDFILDLPNDKEEMNKIFEERNSKIENGLNSFAKHFQDLWD